MSTLDQSQVAGSTLGYAQITSNFSTTSSTSVQVTGLTITVTIPSGGRKVKITVFAASMGNNTAGAVGVCTLWDGAVGSGTQISQFNAAAGVSPGMTMVGVVTPAAGTKTYNVGLYEAFGGTAQISAFTTGPAFILVELI